MEEINPMNTNRAASWKLYKNAPMPMVTIFKTLDISNLLRLHSRGYKLNMLMCCCIAWAADEVAEFRLLPVDKKMLRYDAVGVNVILANHKGSLNTCDIPFFPTLKEFNAAYLEVTKKVYRQCINHEIENHMIVGTSSLVNYDIDGVVNMYSGVFNNPFLIWGKYREKNKQAKLQVSFQFHHVQMDGLQACVFLEKLQRKIIVLTI